MRVFLIVVVDPCIKVSLKVFKASIHLLAEGDLVELFFDRTVKTFADPIRLGAVRFRAGVLDAVYRQKQLKVMALRSTTVLRSTVCQNAYRGTSSQAHNF